MLKDIEGDRPRHGPFRDGPLPSIESILQPQPRSPERLKTVPPRNGTRRGHRYSIVRNRCSVGLKWWDAQGEEHYKNVGQVSDEEAERLAEELTKPIREQVFHAQALAKSRYRETLKNALTPIQTAPSFGAPQEVKERAITPQQDPKRKKRFGRPRKTGAHESSICEVIHVTADFEAYLDVMIRRRERPPEDWRVNSYANLTEPLRKRAMDERYNHIRRCKSCQGIIRKKSS